MRAETLARARSLGTMLALCVRDEMIAPPSEGGGSSAAAIVGICLSIRELQKLSDAETTPKAVVALFAIAELILDGSGVDE